MIEKTIFRMIVILFVCFSLTACREEDAEISLSAEAGETTQKDVDNKQKNSTGNEENDSIVVYVSGAVKNPGVYTLHSGDRVYQAVDKAGGMTSKAKKDALNLAETVSDAQNIYVMTKKEYGKNHVDNNSAEEKKGISKQLVNINIADNGTLSTLPGIGITKAAAIIAYREEKGVFSSKEDIKNVSGIGDATYDGIKDLITIE